MRLRVVAVEVVAVETEVDYLRVAVAEVLLMGQEALRVLTAAHLMTVTTVLMAQTDRPEAELS